MQLREETPILDFASVWDPIRPLTGARRLARAGRLVGVTERKPKTHEEGASRKAPFLKWFRSSKTDE